MGKNKSAGDDWVDVPITDDWVDVPVERESVITPVESGLLGAGQGVAMGFGDEIAGGLAAAKNYATGGEFNYKEKQKEFQDYLDRAQKTNPKSYLAGNVGGGVASAFIPGLGIAKGASLARGVGQAAAQSALTGLGESKGSFLGNANEQKQALQDMAIGGTIGGVSQGVMSGLGKGVTALSDSLKDSAAKRAFKAGVGQNKAQWKEAVKTKQLIPKGNAALVADEAGDPIIGAFSKTEDIYPRAQEKAKFFGKKIGEVSDEIDKHMPKAVDGKKIANDIMEYAATIPENEGTAGIIDKLQREALRYEKRGAMSFADAQNSKGGYKFKVTDTSTHGFGQDASNALKNIVGKNMDETAEIMSDQAAKSGNTGLADLLDKYGYYKQKYGANATFADAGEDRAISNMSNRIISPSDYAAGIGGSGIGAIAGAAASGDEDKLTGALTGASLGAGIGLGHRVLRERGPAMAAHGIKKFGEVVGNKSAGRAIEAGSRQLARETLDDDFARWLESKGKK